MSALKLRLWSLSTTDDVMRQPRDIDDAVYPQRIALEITGLEDHVLRLWHSRGVLDGAELDGDMTPQEGRSYVRRTYSTMDLLKLRVMAELVWLGVPREVAADAIAKMEATLTDEDRTALEKKKLPKLPLIFMRAGDSLEVLDIRSWGEARSHICFTGKFVGVVVDWPGIAEFVFEKLKQIDRVGEIA